LPLLVALLLPLAAWSELQAAALRGLRRLPLAVAGDGILRPLVTAGLVIAAWLAVPGSATAPVALAAYVGGTAAAALLTATALRAALGAGAAGVAPGERAAWRRLGLSLMIANGALVAMYSVDAVLLGWLAGPREAGLFGVASRVAVAVLFVMNAAQLAGGPRLAAAVALGDAAGLGAVVRTMNRLALLAAVPVALLVALPAGWLLGLFGPDFTAATDVLRILVVAQLLNVLTGPTGTILRMGGRERDLAVLVTAGLGLHVLLAAWLIPAYGLAGAACAGLIAHTAWNVAAAWRVRRVFGIDPTVAGLLRRA
jgi:O-antigen/teichoic acid export membrane protein